MTSQPHESDSAASRRSGVRPSARELDIAAQLAVEAWRRWVEQPAGASDMAERALTVTLHALEGVVRARQPRPNAAYNEGYRHGYDCGWQDAMAQENPPQMPETDEHPRW